MASAILDDDRAVTIGDAVRRLATRRSPAPDCLVAPGPRGETLEALLRIALRVPDHGRLTPWRLIVVEGAAKARWLDALTTIADRRDDAPKARVGLRKLASAPLVVVIVSTPIAGHKVPEWEQILSAGAVGMNLLNAAAALGYGGNWLTGWHAYDAEAQALLGIRDGERIAGVVPIGTVAEPSADRERPDLAKAVTYLA